VQQLLASSKQVGSSVYLLGMCGSCLGHLSDACCVACAGEHSCGRERLLLPAMAAVRAFRLWWGMEGLL
jgi:hypothetical protein